MVSTIDESQNSVFAQNITSTLLPPQLPAQDSTSTPTIPPATPTIEPSGSDDESSSSDDSDNNNGNGDETSSSSGSEEDDNGDDNDSQQDTSSSDKEETETEDNFEQTNLLLEQIRNNVNGTLFASGITVP